MEEEVLLSFEDDVFDFDEKDKDIALPRNFQCYIKSNKKSRVR